MALAQSKPVISTCKIRETEREASIMSTHDDRRRVAVEIGDQEQFPSAPINKERVVRSQSESHDHEGNKAVEQVVFAESGEGDVEGLRSHAIRSSSKEEKKLDEKKGDCKPAPENIDECAEEFIRRFRKQLQIQRLQSLENYEQMLTRGL